MAKSVEGVSSAATEPDRVRVRRKRRVRRRRRVPQTARWILLGLGAVGLLLFLDASYTAFTLTRELRATRDSLQRGADLIEAGDVDGAAVSFAAAQTSAGRADGAAHHPAAWLFGTMPGLGDDLHAIRSLITASDYSAQAGESLALAARSAGWSADQLPGVKPGGAIDVGLITAATPALERAASLLGAADRALEPIPTAGLLRPIGNAVDTAQALIGDRARLAERAATVSKFLPGFLGGEGTRRYVILMMNLADPRGSGGYPGSYGLLTIDGGRIGLQDLAPTFTLGRVPPIGSPSPEYATRYATFGGLSFFIASTYSPDFPTSAQVFMRMWEASGRQPIDGVIGGDSVLLADLLGAMGPVETPEWPETITVENVNQIMNADTFRTGDQARSDRWQTAIGTALWQALLDRPISPSALGSALSSASSERHLQMYLTDPAQEQLLGELGVAGSVDLGPNPLLVSWSGVTPSRAGYFARTAIDYAATTQEDGSTRVTVTLTLTNTAPPAGPQSILFGFKSDPFPLGEYSGLASIYLPEGATAVSSKGDAEVSFSQHEFDHRALVQVLTAHAGASASSTIFYTLPAGYLAANGLTLIPQPSLNPPAVMVRVDGRLVFDGILTATTSLPMAS